MQWKTSEISAFEGYSRGGYAHTHTHADTYNSGMHFEVGNRREIVQHIFQAYEITRTHTHTSSCSLMHKHTCTLPPSSYCPEAKMFDVTCSWFLTSLCLGFLGTKNQIEWDYFSFSFHNKWEHSLGLSAMVFAVYIFASQI